MLFTYPAVIVDSLHPVKSLDLGAIVSWTRPLPPDLQCSMDVLYMMHLSWNEHIARICSKTSKLILVFFTDNIQPLQPRVVAKTL